MSLKQILPGIEGEDSQNSNDDSIEFLQQTEDNTGERTQQEEKDSSSELIDFPDLAGFVKENWERVKKHPWLAILVGGELVILPLSLLTEIPVQIVALYPAALIALTIELVLFGLIAAIILDFLAWLAEKAGDIL